MWNPCSESPVQMQIIPDPFYYPENSHAIPCRENEIDLEPLSSNKRKHRESTLNTGKGLE